MTPEERAEEVVDVGNEFGVSGDGDRHLKAAIANAIRAAVAEAVELAAQLCEARAAGVQDAIDEGGSTPALAEMVSQFSSLAESCRAVARQQDKGART